MSPATPVISSTSEPSFSTNTISPYTSVVVGSSVGVLSSGLSSSTKYAVFEIGVVSPLLLFTCTWKLTVASPPFFATSTGIPASNSANVYSVSLSFTVIVPSSPVVPCGAVSLIIAVPSTFPVFVAVNVYVIVSPSLTSASFATFVRVITGLYTSIVSVFVSLSPTVAVLLI